MIEQHAIEQRLVAIAQRRDSDVFLEVVGVTGDLRVDTARLLIQRLALVRYQTLEPEGLTLLRGERRALVQQRRLNQLDAALANLEAAVDLVRRRHAALLFHEWGQRKNLPNSTRLIEPVAAVLL